MIWENKEKRKENFKKLFKRDRQYFAIILLLSAVLRLSLCEISMSLGKNWTSRAAAIFRMTSSVDSYEFSGAPLS